MATSRPSSLIIPTEVFDETNINNSSKKYSTIKQERSSSSSVDSNNIKNINNNNISSENFVRTQTTTSSTTTTDSDLESEHDEQNQSHNTQKSDTNSQEQLSRREKHFYKLFKSEIQDDMPDLIDSYVCAYQGDILLQGKMYITDRYLCFHSRIISYVTKHVYRWEQIEDVTKERVAFIFPTAIGIQLKQNDKKVTYASFLQRDQAFEKIQFIWSRANHDLSSYDDDDNDNRIHNGTLKASNQNGKNTNTYKRNSYDIIEGPEEDGVLDMCLKSKKSNYDKQQSTMLPNLYNKKSVEKTLTNNQKLFNDINDNMSKVQQTNRHSRYTKHEKKPNNVEKRNASVVNHQRTKLNSVKYRQSQSQSQDRTSFSADQQTISNSNSMTTTTTTNMIPTRNVSIVDSQSNGILTKLLNLLVPVINFITQTIPSYIHQLQTLPLKTTACILLFLLILFIHAFYLMKLANRIEHRLQSLHHLWPSSTKHPSFTSNSKDL